MSRARSSKAGCFARAALLVFGAAVASACTHQTQGGAGDGGSQSVGYVRMKELVAKHPLFAQLSKYDDDIAALQLKSVGGPQVADNGADIQKEEVTLQHELTDAANRTRELLKEKQTEYQQRENEAIKEALAASGAPVPAGAGAIASQIQATSNEQAQQVAREARTDMDVFRRETIAQDNSAVSALRKSLAERADRTYRAKAEELREKESSFALQEANADAPARLSLKTKLSNLPLDDSGRKDITDQLDALDRKETDALAAMRNRDQATLAALQTQLRTDTAAEFTHEISAIHKRTNSKLADRASQTQGQLLRQLGGTVSGTASTASVTVPSLSGDMKAKLLALHKQYQDDFSRDAGQTVKAFYKTKDDLSRRFAELHGVDAGAQGDVQRQIGDLQHRRDQLYDEIVAQIGREVKLVAQQRDVGVVFSDVVAPANGVDLTADAEKDIESLHE